MSTPEFLQNVYLLSALSSVTFGLIGALVVARRVGYLAGAISHCAFGGIGFGLWLKQTISVGAFGILTLATFFSSPENAPKLCERWSSFVDPVPSALIFAVLAALLVDAIRRRAKEREETLLGAIWAIGMALGLLFLERVDGYVSVSTYLFGDVLLISKWDVATSALLGGAILAIVALDFKRLEAVCFDEEFAELRGIDVAVQNRLLLTLTAVSVVLMLRVVGMAMIVAMLTLPAATAGRFTKRLGTMILGSIGVCFLGSWLGIWLSFVLNTSTGPTIILVVAVFYGISLLFGKR